MRDVSLRALGARLRPCLSHPFFDEIDKSISKLQIVQTVQNVQNWSKTDGELLKNEELMKTDGELMKTDGELMKD